MACFFAISASLLPSQDEKKTPSTTVEAQKQEEHLPPYNPRGRRDPFRNLLRGRDVKEKALVGGIPQMSIDEFALK